MSSQSEIFLRQQAIQARCFHPTGDWIEFQAAEIEQSIVSRFEQIAALYPNHLAVKMGNEQLTYNELNQAANRLARAILAQCGVGAEPVLFLLEQGVQAMVSILGILKTGKFYAALDPTYPQARLQTILTDTQATLLITNQCNLALATTLAGQHHVVLNLNELPNHLATTNLDLRIAPDAFAYLMYTSGSTGLPNGVVENHRNVLHFTRVFTNTLHLCAEDRLGLTLSNSFGGSVSNIFPALLNGASLFPYDLTTQGINRAIHWLREEKITYWVFVPTVFRQFAQAVANEAPFPHLRLIGLGGDRVLPADIALYQQHFPAPCLLRIGYGLTEVKLVAQYFVDHATSIAKGNRDGIADGIVPVGYCVEQTAVSLVDEAGNPLGPNEMGEIVIRSRYIAPGYWQRPELTQARFQPDPFDNSVRLYYTGDLGLLRPDGCLLHLGRKDHQVKISGVRIEATEIEQALWASSWFKEVLVMANPTQQGEQQLVAYLVPHTKPAPTVSVLRRYLAAILPAPLIPAAFIMLDALPLNANKKVDRRVLPTPDHALRWTRPELDTIYAAYRTPGEASLITLWEEVLGIQPVGIYDHFTDLGGDSLSAMQIHTRLCSEWHTTIPLPQLFECANIAEMAVLLTQYAASQLDPVALEQLLITVENSISPMIE